MKRTIAILALFFAAPAWAARSPGGTYTLPPGNPVQAGTKITTTWANTTLSDLAAELTASLDRNGKGAMLGPLKCTDGSASYPSMTFNNEQDTGLYRLGLNKLGISIGGGKRWEHDTKGQTEYGTLTVNGWLTANSWVDVIGTTTLRGATRIPILNAGYIASINPSSALSLVAPAGFDALLSASNTVAFTARASGTNDNMGRRLANVAAPTAAQDAATKAYVDAAKGASLANDWVRLLTTTEMTTNVATGVDVPGLSFPVVAGHKYLVRGTIWVKSNTIDNGVTYSCKATLGPTLTATSSLAWKHWQWQSLTTSQVMYRVAACSDVPNAWFDDIEATTGIGTFQPDEFNAYLDVTAGGTFQMRVASEGAGPIIYVGPGSYLEYLDVTPPAP